MVKTIEWTGDAAVMIDQRNLPADETDVTCRSYEDVADAIRTMVSMVMSSSVDVLRLPTTR